MNTANYRRLITYSKRSPWMWWLVFVLIVGAAHRAGANTDHCDYTPDYQDLTTEGTDEFTQTTPLPVIEYEFETTTVQITTDTYSENNFYCRADLCLQYDFYGQLVQKQHVACGHDGSFAEDCPPGRTLFKIDPQIEAFIIHMHNDARNRLANGSMDGFQSASRMPSLVWNEELAKLAELNAKSCKFEHDECRSTDQFRQAGQNLAIGYYPVEENIFDILEKLTALWFNEYLDANQNVMDAFDNLPNATIGHFTQMMSDRTTAIGCGIVIYPHKVSGFTFKVVLYVCNYSLTNINGQPVYRKGIAAEKCLYGSNPYYNGLCIETENYLVQSVPYYED